MPEYVTQTELKNEVLRIEEVNKRDRHEFANKMEALILPIGLKLDDLKDMILESNKNYALLQQEVVRNKNDLKEFKKEVKTDIDDIKKENENIKMIIWKALGSVSIIGPLIAFGITYFLNTI